MKCECCGANLGMFKKYVTLSDGAICKKCFEALDFDFTHADQYANAKVNVRPVCFTGQSIIKAYRAKNNRLIY